MMQVSNEERVRARAYEMWINDGMAAGRELDYWYAAEREMSAAQGLDAMIAAAKPAPKSRKPRAKKKARN